MLPVLDFHKIWSTYSKIISTVFKLKWFLDKEWKMLEIVKEYDQEIPQPQTADNPKAPRGRQLKQSNQLSLPHQDDCNTRMDIK